MASYRYPNLRLPTARRNSTAAGPRGGRWLVIGARPVGLAVAIDLARHGVPVLVLDDDDTGFGSAAGRSAGPSARWKSWTDWASGADGADGHKHGRKGKVFFPYGPAGLRPSTCCRRGGQPDAGLRQPAASIMLEAVSDRGGGAGSRTATVRFKNPGVRTFAPRRGGSDSERLGGRPDGLYSALLGLFLVACDARSRAPGAGLSGSLASREWFPVR